MVAGRRLRFEAMFKRMGDHPNAGLTEIHYTDLDLDPKKGSTRVMHVFPHEAPTFRTVELGLGPEDHEVGIKSLLADMLDDGEPPSTKDHALARHARMNVIVPKGKPVHQQVLETHPFSHAARGWLFEVRRANTHRSAHQGPDFSEEPS